MSAAPRCLEVNSPAPYIMLGTRLVPSNENVCRQATALSNLAYTRTDSTHQGDHFTGCASAAEVQAQVSWWWCVRRGKAGCWE